MLMKKNKAIIIIVVVILLIGVIAGGFIVIKYDMQKKYSQLPTLNACYDLVLDCYENGFNKDTAEENKKLFKTALEFGMSKELYKASKFNGTQISFAKDGYQNPEYVEKYVNEVNHTRDLICAMYLTCVLVTEPENLTAEFNWLLGGSYELLLHPEFNDLVVEKYPITQEEFDLIANSYLAFARTLKDPVDKYYTLAFPFGIVQNYNDNNSENLNGDVLTDLGKESISTYEEIDDLPNVWIGYNNQ